MTIMMTVMMMMTMRMSMMRMSMVTKMSICGHDIDGIAYVDPSDAGLANCSEAAGTQIRILKAFEGQAGGCSAPADVRPAGMQLAQKKRAKVSYYYMPTAPRAVPAVVAMPVRQIYIMPRASVSYYYMPTAPRAVPAVVAMSVRQIYILPRASVPAASFWPNFPVKAANVPLTRPVAAATRSLAPGPPKTDRPARAHTSVVQTATKTVDSKRTLRCCLIDVRGDDRASGYIQGAVHEPTSFQAPLLNRVPELVEKFGNEKLVIFHCQYSLHRGPQCANWYREQAPPTQLGPRSPDAYSQRYFPPHVLFHRDGYPRFVLLRAHGAEGRASRRDHAGEAVLASGHLGASRRDHAGEADLHHATRSCPRDVLLAQFSRQGCAYPRECASVLALQSLAPGPGKMERMQAPVVHTTTKTVGVEKLLPGEVCELLHKGQCCLVDVRGEDRASGHIEGAVHEPTSFQAPLLNRVPELVEKFGNEKLVIFHCQYSLHRGPQWDPKCANWYRQQAPPTQRVAVMEGGFRGWEGQRLPVVREKAMDANGQAKADVYALSMGRRVAGAGA
eukprot:s1772_g17.t1